MPSQNISQERKETMGSKKNVDMGTTEDTVKVVEAVETEKKSDDQKSEIKKAEKAAPKKSRSKKYARIRSKVDKTRKYSIKEAVEKIKTLSYTKFDGTISLDGVVKEIGKVATLTLPHSTGRMIKVAVVDDAVLAQIEAGNLDFDALVTSPQFMPKLAKFARILGPKGLMPNPKNGTVTPKPEIKKAEIEKGTFELKTEKKAPVIHIVIGKVSMDDKVLIENIEALFVATKGRLLSASISATMSPSIKLDIEK